MVFTHKKHYNIINIDVLQFRCFEPIKNNPGNVGLFHMDFTGALSLCGLCSGVPQSGAKVVFIFWLGGLNASESNIGHPSFLIRKARSKSPIKLSIYFKLRINQIHQSDFIRFPSGEQTPISKNCLSKSIDLFLHIYILFNVFRIIAIEMGDVCQFCMSLFTKTFGCINMWMYFAGFCQFLHPYF